MYSTKTGGFPIGFRRGWSDWQKNLPDLCTWAVSAGFLLIDVGSNAADSLGVIQSGLKVGSADMAAWSGLMDSTPGSLELCLEANEALLKEVTPKGVTNFFTVLLPKDHSKPRSENFELLKVGLGKLASLYETYNAKLVIEGWPGQGALGCTPESLRAIFKAVPSSAIGLNFDPSHLIRMGIDPVRFANEFSSRIYHVHGKDCMTNSEAKYEFGTEIGATVAKGHDFGLHAWRYTIPGHGTSDWSLLLSILKNAGYKGGVCIELEDENFNGSEAGEKLGLNSSAQFLSAC